MKKFIVIMVGFTIIVAGLGIDVFPQKVVSDTSRAKMAQKTVQKMPAKEKAISSDSRNKEVREEKKETYKGKIGAHAFIPYDTENFPKTVKKYGSRLKEIEQLRRKAAAIAIDSGKCDVVEMAELSTFKSSLSHLHFWVDCRNGERIRLDEFEIKDKKTAFTEEEKAWDEVSARAACKKAIKSRALIPSEVDIHDITGTSFYKARVTHNVVLTMNFDAKNAFGVEIPYTAKCYFQPGEVGEIVIHKR